MVSQRLKDKPAATPFAPEKIDRMRARFGDAIRDDYDIPCEHPWPGEQRRHIFDWPDGLRLIVSVDAVYPDVGPQLHVSAGVVRGSTLDRMFCNLPEEVIFSSLASLGPKRFRELCQFDCPLSDPFKTPCAVHFFGPTRSELTAATNSEKGVPR